MTDEEQNKKNQLIAKLLPAPPRQNHSPAKTAPRTNGSDFSIKIGDIARLRKKTKKELAEEAEKKAAHAAQKTAEAQVEATKTEEAVKRAQAKAERAAKKAAQTSLEAQEAAQASLEAQKAAELEAEAEMKEKLVQLAEKMGLSTNEEDISLMRESLPGLKKTAEELELSIWTCSKKQLKKIDELSQP